MSDTVDGHAKKAAVSNEQLAHDWIVRNPDIWESLVLAVVMESSTSKRFSVRDWLCHEKFTRGCNGVDYCEFKYPHDATHSIARYLIELVPKAKGFVTYLPKEDEQPLPLLPRDLMEVCFGA